MLGKIGFESCLFIALGKFEQKAFFFFLGGVILSIFYGRDNIVSVRMLHVSSCFQFGLYISMFKPIALCSTQC